MLLLASESIGEKAIYLLTAYIRENEGLTQVMLQAVSDKSYGLNGFLNEIVDGLRHIVSTVQSAREIGVIKKEQVINIIDSVVQRTTFGGGEGAAEVNIEGSVVQRTEIKIGEDKKQPEEDRPRMEEEALQDKVHNMQSMPEPESTLEEHEIEKPDTIKSPDVVIEDNKKIEFTQRSYLNTFKDVILSPGDFFSEMSKVDENKHAIKFATKNFTIIGLIFALFIGGGLGEFLGALIGVIIFGIIGLYICGILFYILFMLVGGSGNYSGTVRILAYSSAVQILSLVPLVGFFAGLYGIWLYVIGGKHVHNLTTKKSAIAVIIPVVFCVFVFLMLLASV